MIHITKVNEVFLKVNTKEKFILAELKEDLSFRIPNVENTPAFKKAKGNWDGRASLFNMKTGWFYAGLLNYVSDYAEHNSFDISYENIFSYEKKTNDYFLNLLETSNCPSKFKPRDYQLFAACQAANLKKICLESPTGTGKSFICYMIILHLLKETKGKIALIVPRTSLVEQMYSDFAEYGFDVKTHVARLYERYEYDPTKRLIITTWQSAYKDKEINFEEFESVIGDEAHTFKAKSLRELMEKFINASYRIGMSGSFPKEKASMMIIQGLFGPKQTVIETKEAINEGYLNEMEPIEIIHLEYDINTCRKIHSSNYQDEISFIISNQKRNEMICSIAANLKGHTLVAFQRVEDHGEFLFKLIKEKTNKPVYFISGKVDVNDREIIRKHVTNSNDDSIIVASMGTFSTGVNIPNLDNLILAMPTKSHETLVQLIGRVLRVSNNKTKVIDLVDNLSYDKKPNYTFQHAVERLKVYSKKKFKYKFRRYKIE